MTSTMRITIVLAALVALVPRPALAQIDALTNAGACVVTGFAAGATTIAVNTGCGATLPASAFNASVCQTTDYPVNCRSTAGVLDPNYEVVRVTAGFGTDSLTITRAQEGTSDAAHNTAAKVYWLSTFTAKTVNDLGSLVNGLLDDSIVLAVAAGTDLTDYRVLEGTANQITVTDGGAGNELTLSTPQDIHTAATPTFGGLTFGTSVFLSDASNVVAQRNGTNAQTSRLYNTYTDASNYERLGFTWATNIARIGTANAGTGTARALSFDYGGTSTAAMTIPITSGPVVFTWIRLGAGSAGDMFQISNWIRFGGGISLGAFDDALFMREAANIIQFGEDVNGAAVPYTLKGHDGITGTNVAGATVTLASGRGTGAGAVSSVLIATPTVGSTGTTAQTNTTRLTIDSSGILATGYKAADGTVGLTQTCTNPVTAITVKNGLITAITCP